MESTFQLCFAHELRKRGLKVETELVSPVEYEGLHLDAGYRIDTLVEEMVIVENKALETGSIGSRGPIADISETAQLSYGLSS